MTEFYGSMSDIPKRIDEQQKPLIYHLYDEPMTGEAIEARSFQIIDREVSSGAFTPEQWHIVRRILHTTADFGLVDNIRFSPDAIEAARSALRTGVPIFVDSNMIRSGISVARLRQACGKYNFESLICHVADEDVAAAARENSRRFGPVRVAQGGGGSLRPADSVAGPGFRAGRIQPVPIGRLPGGLRGI